MLRSAVILTLVLGLYWLGLSGYFKTLLLSLGVISVALVLLLCARMRILDDETVPYLAIPKTLSYFYWLGREIVKANIAVTKTVLKPDMEISPTLVKIPTGHKTDMGRTMFANSITLTPGTVSVDVEDDHILVHALQRSMAKLADFTDMANRAGWAVGDTPSTKKGGR